MTLKHATFQWEEVLAVEDAKEAQAKAKEGKASVAAVDPRQVDDTPPFQVQTSQC